MTKETIIENTCEVTIIPQLDVAAVESIYSSLSVKLQSITITPKFEESFLEKALSFGGGFALAAGVLGTVVEMFSNLMSTNEEFGAAVDEVWTQITEAFAPVTDAVMNLITSLGEEGMGGSFSWFSDALNGISELAVSVK